jgi:uncharacterized protein (DUF1697 family)
MKRYAAFLRGVSPMNARMPELRAAFESSGFATVKTLLSSGNVVFDAPAASEAALQRKAEAAITARLGQPFLTIVRSIEDLHALLASDPFARARLAPEAKRVVTFLRTPPTARLPKLPIEIDGARIVALHGREAFTAYTPSPKGPVFMQLIERTFGKDVTTRTWQTVEKAARA